MEWSKGTVYSITFNESAIINEKSLAAIIPKTDLLKQIYLGKTGLKLRFDEQKLAITIRTNVERSNATLNGQRITSAEQNLIINKVNYLKIDGVMVNMHAVVY